MLASILLGAKLTPTVVSADHANRPCLLISVTPIGSTDSDGDAVQQSDETSHPGNVISSPEDGALDDLCRLLEEASGSLDANDAWPQRQLDWCGQYGVHQWFLPSEHGGQGWSDADIYRGYLKLSAACLTTTFILTQRTGACRRIAACRNVELKERFIPGLLSGALFATVGISHLTTSRRHLAKPVLQASERDGGFVLDGFSPWVTGGEHADVVVTGATMDDGRQILAALPMDLDGVSADKSPRLVGLSASHTGAVRCDNVFLTPDLLIDGPIENVMAQGSGAKSGGLQTSALALGLTVAAIKFLADESSRRPELIPATESLAEEHASLVSDLLRMAAGEPVVSSEHFRARANSITLRSTQAALAAAKGTGYLVGHPTGRWCREALFFLVWSCPQPVLEANLCELAGLSG